MTMLLTMLSRPFAVSLCAYSINRFSSELMFENELCRIAFVSAIFSSVFLTLYS